MQINDVRYIIYEVRYVNIPVSFGTTYSALIISFVLYPAGT